MQHFDSTSSNFKKVIFRFRRDLPKQADKIFDEESIDSNLSVYNSILSILTQIPVISALGLSVASYIQFIFSR